MTAPTGRAAALVLLAAVLGVPASAPRLEGRAPGARDLYQEAVALDRDARIAADRGDDAEARAHRTARRALALYESVVRRFPASGYCDNALMGGGDLARWLFTRSGRSADRAAAAKYYAWLIREYPASGLQRQARSAARGLETLEPAQRRAAVAASVPAPPHAVPRLPVSTSAAAPSAPLVAAPATPATLRGIDRSVVHGAVRVTLMLDRETLFAHELLEGPRRAFVDLYGATPAADLQDAAIRYDTDVVRQVRVGLRPGATRVVLDLDGTPAVSVFMLYNPFRVVIDTERSTGAATVPDLSSTSPPAGVPAVLRDDEPAPPRDENELVPQAIPAPAVSFTASSGAAVTVGGLAIVSEPAALSAPPLPVVPSAPAATLTVAASTAPAVPAPAAAATWGPGLDAARTAPVPAVPAVNGDGTFSLARQLGLGISRIVIDPGHGGHDPGTLTQGTNEARLVLDVALRLERLLAKEPGLEVVLTRRTDVFIPLEQRTAIANREGADLFLSIHANASRDTKAGGVETYFLSFASNPEAEAVAARENATSASDMHSLPSIVRAIALNNKLDESRDLAGMVQQALAARLSKANPAMRSRGVKKAPFVVLIGAGMPSVLAEIGFLTNRQESGLVKTPAYRQRIAESLHAAILQYRRALKRQTSVATR